MPADESHGGPARIVSLSKDSFVRNFTLAQAGTQYVLRLRTSGTDAQGMPEVRSEQGALKTQRQHVVVTYRNGKACIYVDGQLVASGNKANSDFNWQQRLNIGFSNDAAGDYFRGQIDDVSIWSDALDEQQIQALAAGASPLTLGGFAGEIDTDVAAQMQNRSSSAYMRATFDVSTPVDFELLVLRMKYDDGFVAYLNGVEVAGANAPAGAGPASTALSDRPKIDALRTVEFNLSSHIGLLRDGTNVLAIHGLNDRIDGDDFLISAELVKVEIRQDLYLSPPTPGEPNSAGVIDFVGDTSFSIDRGFYDEAFDTVISSTTPGASIAYTTDGGIPSPTNGTQVHAPNDLTPPQATVRITTTTNLRAIAYKTGFQSTNVDTHTYIFIDDVARQSAVQPGFTGWSEWQVDPDVVNTTLPGFSFRDALLSIPTMSITTERGELFGSNGIYTNSTSRGSAWERAASLEMFNPDGTTEFQIDVGLRMHGNSSRNHGFTLKHPIRVLFKEKWGPTKLVHDLFPDSDVDRFDQILLRGASTDSWPVVDGGSRWLNERATYIRDQWVRDAQIALGQPAGHGTYVHLFLNGLYWGLYNPTERPTASFAAEHIGGDKDDWDILKDFAELREGNKTAWNEMFAQASAGLAGTAAYQRIQGNNPDGTRNTDYPVLVDVDNLIDYMLVHIYIGAEDWHQHNWWAGRQRGPDSTGFKWFAWDQEISNESLTRTVSLAGARFEDPYYGRQGPAEIYGRLLANEAFRWRFQDRVHEVLFNDGPLTSENAAGIWLARQNEIDQAIVGESARWGDTRDSVPHKRETAWLREMNWMRDVYWEANHARVLRERFRRVGIYPNIVAPVFSQHGGRVEQDFELTMTAPAGTVYYTLDGSDPRRADGSLSPTALVFDGATTSVPLVAAGSRWSYLDDGSDQTGSGWQEPDFNDALWQRGDAQLGYGDGDEQTTLSFGDDDADKHITTYFRHAFDADDPAALTGLTLRLLRDDGAVVYLNGQEIERSNMPTGAIGHDTPARDTIGGDDESTFFAFSIDPAALRPGRNVLAVEIHQRSGTSSDISFDLSLEGTISTATPLVLTNSGLVASRAKVGNSWSALNSATFIVDVPTITISEIHYNPAGPPLGSVYVASDFEFIEIHNFGAAPVELANVRFVDGISFDFTDSNVTRLAPGGYAIVVADRDAFLSRHAGFDTSLIAGVFPTSSLNNGGEDVVLVDPFDEVIVELEYNNSWHTLSDGAGFSLTRIDEADRLADLSKKAAWRPSSHVLGSPGEADSADLPAPGAIVINEVLSHTDSALGDRIELLNTTDEPIVIGGWFLSDDVSLPRKYRIAEGTTIMPGDFRVFSQATYFANIADPGVLVPFALSELGEQVVFTAADAGGALLGFRARQNFGAAENGISFGLLTKSTGGTDFVATQFPTLGLTNAPPKIGPVVIHELYYHPNEVSTGEHITEFIELKNITNEAVSLAGWTIDGVGAQGGGDFTFGDIDLIPAGGLLLVVPVDPEQFRQSHQVSADVSIVGPYDGALNNAGENVRLSKPGPMEPGGEVPMITVDRVNYNVTAPW
ncbi:MAG: lamin tail domain-containing protein, partial [Planctomycetes bacterium]|nr:lamin tail domain-containing protein [Planctomycetota bacterium]